MALISKWFSMGIVCAIPFLFISPTTTNAQPEKPQVIWENNKPVGVTFHCEQNELETDLLRVSIIGKDAAILGNFIADDYQITFRPVIAFSYHIGYAIFYRNDKIGEFEIPFPGNTKTPDVVSVYPSSGTIPANMLKIHIQFSQPMREGKSADYVHLMNASGDTIQQVFLDLQPELWNEDRTSLTLWLDPGRIKRDLQPNLKLGTPLIAGNEYKLVISKLWPDQNGLLLNNDFVANYSVDVDDRSKPDPKLWKVSCPKANSKEPLIIDFRETLDGVLAKNAIRVVKAERLVNGTVTLEEQETKWVFTPANSWVEGDYEIHVESRLEDLSGNNLNRLFDRDLTKESNLSSHLELYTIPFKLESEAMQ